MAIMKVIYRGAESLIGLSDFEGHDAIIKQRVAKSYRIKRLDDKLRKGRTRKEVKLLTEARKIGIATPKILQVDENNCSIVMENISGVRVKEFLLSADTNGVKKVCFEIGRIVGKLHQGNIVHGDLTTSNMILKDDTIYFIDFSLGSISSRVEDKGVDLNLFSEALNSTHFKIAHECWRNFVEGYKNEYKNAEDIIKKVKEIRMRARYAERKEF